MLDNDIQFKSLLKELFRTQLFASLSTLQAEHPYNNLVAFATTDDLKSILFVTKRGTRKYSNLISNNNVSVLIDNRTNRDSDLRTALAVSAVGTAEVVKDSRKEELYQLFLLKHYNLESFARSPESELFQIRVKCYYAVRNFQEVVEIKVESG